MGKIKLNLVSGTLIEKTLVNAFKANNNEYVVLDNETIGQMGLPIILVSKIDNNKLVKIVDQNEWQIVKEYLKNIIAGNQIELIKVNKEMMADDIYYTQLTLPIPSFETLKSAYGNLGNEMIDVVASQPETIVQNVETPQTIETPAVETPQVAPTPIVEPQAVETPTNVINDINPIGDINPIDTSVNNNVTNEINSTPSPVDFGVNMSTNEEDSSVMNNEIPNTSPISTPTNIDEMLKQEKDTFMKACENMFDALVEKLKNQYNK